MTLQDYTTDELKAELKRRQAEARKAANANRDRKHKYLYAEGTVTSIYRTRSGMKLHSQNGVSRYVLKTNT